MFLSEKGGEEEEQSEEDSEKKDRQRRPRHLREAMERADVGERWERREETVQLRMMRDGLFVL